MRFSNHSLNFFEHAITRDNVTIEIDGVLYLRIVDPEKASYGVRDPYYAGIETRNYFCVIFFSFFESHNLLKQQCGLSWVK